MRDPRKNLRCTKYSILMLCADRDLRRSLSSGVQWKTLTRSFDEVTTFLPRRIEARK